MNAQHTPGPWELTGRATIRTRALVPNIGRQLIAHVHWRDGRANADLIAAAPELLDLAQAVLHAAAEDLITNTSDEDTTGVLLDFARLTVAKATGLAANVGGNPRERSAEK